MNCQEIKNLALLLCGQREIPDNYVFMYINEAINDLAIRFETAGKKLTDTISAIKNRWIDLPNSCLSVKRCLLDDMIYDDFLIENGQIQFPITHDFNIEYLTYPDRVVELADTPNMHEAFHEALAYYVAYKEMTRIFMHEDLTEGSNKILLITEYHRKAEQANIKLSTMKKSRRRIKRAPFI